MIVKDIKKHLSPELVRKCVGVEISEQFFAL